MSGQTPEILDRMADLVLDYRPVEKEKEPYKRKSRAKPKKKARKPKR